jgi:nucleoid DNA-binding protein
MAGIHEIAKAAGLKADVVTDVFEAVFQLVRSGESVRIAGFGSFDKKTFPGRTVKSPVINEGAPITFGESFRIAFKQSDQAKRRLNMSRKKREAKRAEREAAIADQKRKKKKLKKGHK